MRVADRSAMSKALCGLLLVTALGCSSPDESEPSVESAPKSSCRLDTRGGATAHSRQAIVAGSTTPSLSLSDGQRDAVGAMLYQQGATWHAFCSATLISQTVVLTAAHCAVNTTLWDGVSSPPPSWFQPRQVAFGIGDDMARAKARLAVREVHFPPNLMWLEADRRMFPSSFGMQPDLAVVVLAEPAEASVPGIQPIPIRELSLDESPGASVLLGGFGKTSWDDTSSTGVRYWTDLTLVTSNALAINTSYQPGAGTVAPGDSGSGSLVVSPDGTLQVLAATTGPLLPSGGNFGGNVRASREWLYQFVTTECSSLGEAGTCDGNLARWCTDGRVMTEDCGAQARACAADSCGMQRCVDPASVDSRCAGLDYFGRCAGSMLEWCVEGEYRHRDCARYAQICGDSRDPLVGFTCLDEPASEPEPEQAELATCSVLDACLAPCDSDMWCALDCFARAEPKAIITYRSFGGCTYCATYPDYCTDAASPGLACEPDCVSPASEACSQCIDAACGTNHCPGR